MTARLSMMRAAGLAVVGSLAVGAGFGVATVVSAATSSASSTAAPAPGSGTPGAPAPGRHHGLGERNFRGSAGTITAIGGSALTLRTEQGSETVNTTGTTTYTREGQSIHFGDLRLGDVVRVAAPPDASAATPGTGTVVATAVEVVRPTLAGRVTSFDGDTIHIVGAGGRLLTVTVTGSTRYLAQGQSSSRSAVTAGMFIRAEGDQDSLTHLTADVVAVGSNHGVMRPAGPGAGAAGASVPGAVFGGPDGPIDWSF